MASDKKPQDSTRRFCKWTGCQERAAWWAKTRFFTTPICERHKKHGDNMFLAVQNGCTEEQRKAVVEAGIVYTEIF